MEVLERLVQGDSLRPGVAMACGEGGIDDCASRRRASAAVVVLDEGVAAAPVLVVAHRPHVLTTGGDSAEYVVAGPVTLRSFIKSDRETVMNFMRGLADGMDFYRDEKNKDAVHKYLGEFYKSNNTEELEETRRVYTQVTPGLPMVTLKAMENMIAAGAKTILITPTLPLVFGSSGFAPVSSLPGWLQVFARVNPVTSAVDLSRNLAIGGGLCTL